jgi:ankyrin repeat protein
LHRAAERNASARAAQMLVEAGARADIRDAADMTPLDYAIEKNKTKVAHYLRDL